MRSPDRAGSIRAACGFLFVLALLRAGAVVLIGRPDRQEQWFEKVTFADHASYEQLADDLRDGVQDAPAFRVPGYPVFMLLTRDLLPAPWLATVLVQQIVDALTALMCFLMARRIAGSAPALLASSFYMLLPSELIWTSRVAPDVLTGFFACCSGLAWLAATRASSPRAVVSLGLLTGLALTAGSMIKPVMAYSPLVYVSATLASGGMRYSWKAALLASILATTVVGPWILRHHNSQRFGMDALTTQDAFEPMGRALVSSGYMGFIDDGGVWAFRDSLEGLFTSRGSIDYARRDSAFRSITWDAIRYNPCRMAFSDLTKWPKFFLNFSGNVSYLGLTPETGKPLPWVAATTAVQSILLLVICLAPFTGKVRREGRPELALAVSWFAFVALACGPIASFRYGMMFYWSIIPLMALLSGMPLQRMRAGWRAHGGG
jgi:4-amino-4-deoxy-L-arabinose transferase-like glycosyltransferase